MSRFLVKVMCALSLVLFLNGVVFADDGDDDQPVKRKKAKKAAKKKPEDSSSGSVSSGGAIRITCDRDATVYVDLVPKGSCPGPVDVRVTAGVHDVMVKTEFDKDEKWQQFKKSITVGDGAVTRVEANEFGRFITYKGAWKVCRAEGYDCWKKYITDNTSSAVEEEKQYVAEAKELFDEETWKRQQIHGVYGAQEYLKNVPYGKHAAEANLFIDSFKNPVFEVLNSNNIKDRKTGMNWYRNANKYINGDTWYKVNAWALDDTFRLPTHDELLMLANYCRANGWGVEDGKKCHDYLNKVLNFIDVQYKDYWTGTMDEKGNFITVDFRNGDTYFNQSTGFALLTYKGMNNNGSLPPRYSVTPAAAK